MIQHARMARVAVLIDAENASPRYAQRLFAEVTTIGEASVRRIYGDFSGTRLSGWGSIVRSHALGPHPPVATASGKNASDIALAIDAMDLLHSGLVDTFDLVSSDSDFTMLATRIREQGLDVYGFGERKAPESFRVACKRFFYADDEMLPVERSIPVAPLSSGSPDPGAAVAAIHVAIESLQPEEGWYFLGAVGNRLKTTLPDFRVKDYGCPKLVTLVEKSAAFDVRRDDKRVYVRPKAYLSSP